MSNCFNMCARRPSVCPRPRCVCHAHPDVPASECLWWKVHFCHTVSNLPNPPKKEMSAASRAQCNPSVDTTITPVHNPPPPQLIERGRRRERAVCFTFCFSSHSQFRLAWFLSQKQMASIESFLCDKSTSSFQPWRFGCYSNCSVSELCVLAGRDLWPEGQGLQLLISFL